MTLVPSVRAQSPNYFPLSKGNTWTYTWRWDTSLIDEERILDTTEIGGKLYHLYVGWALDLIGITRLSVDTLRTDSLGRVWRFENRHEYMVFDFSTNGDYLSHTSYPEVCTVHVQRKVDITVPAGYFTNCVDLFFGRSFYDESVGYVFAPGIGIVKWYGPFLGPHALLRARVDGKLISSVKPVFAEIPSEFELDQNYPNPFNPTTGIRYHLPAGQAGVPGVSEVRLAIFDLLGREVTVLVDERKQAGHYEVKFSGVGLPTGVYIYRLMAGQFVQYRKMVLMK